MFVRIFRYINLKTIKVMYSAKEIDRMSIDELEGLGCYLSPDQMSKWSGMGYDGKTFVELTKE